MLITIMLLLILSHKISSQEKINFEDYYLNELMRIDYYHIGSSKTEIFTIDKIYRYGQWSANKNNFIDLYNNGKYYYKVYDFETQKLIFSKGFDTFFQEYAATKEGNQGIIKSFNETALIPFPKKK